MMSFFNFRYDLGTMALNNAGKLRKHHQIIGIFSTKKGIFNHKSTPPEGAEGFYFLYNYDIL